MSLFCYLFTFAINLWLQTFVTADVTAVFVNNQHNIQRQGQDFDENKQTQAHSLSIHSYTYRPRADFNSSRPIRVTVYAE